MVEESNAPDVSEEVILKYKEKLKEEFEKKQRLDKEGYSELVSKEYALFKKQYLPTHYTLYEKLCNISEKIIKVAPDSKKEKELREGIEICHLNVTPMGVTSFSVLAPIVIILVGSLISYAVFSSFFFVVIFLIAGTLLIQPLGKLPVTLANNWRLKASNQMVICIFYVVTYMRHTSNLENAINFAAEHITGPLSLDLKKVLWDVETARYDSVKESLDMYLETWRKWNMEFIEAFHLVESSLYESSEDRRLSLLDKALSVILSETYEKMLHYAQNLKSPITMLHMLGIILPILGLVILPLVVNFIESVKWYHLAMLYNVLLPIGVYYMGRNILSKRPTGYGETDISEYVPELKKYKNIIIKIDRFEIPVSPLWIAIGVFVVFFMIGTGPLIMHWLGVSDFNFIGEKFKFLGYRESKIVKGKIIGPYGLGAAIVSLAITLAFGTSIGIYHQLRSKNVIKLRNESKQLEDEFASALFQLGNRLGDGLPAEIAFGKVAEVMSGTTSGKFFQMVDSKMKQAGIGLKEAIFDEKTGVLRSFPSKLIESSMKVLIESIKKGPVIAAQALLNISRYIKEIHRVNERLKDLLSDIISSMKSQINFLTPIIAGIVIGITSMITAILNRLNEQIRLLGSEQQGNTLSGIAQMFGDGIPTYYFQIIVGIYVVQIVYILTVLANGIENGSDKLNEQYMIGKNLIKAPLLYVIVSAVIMIIFNMIAGQIMEATLAMR